LAQLPGVAVDLSKVQTNMVFADFDASAAAVVDALRAVGVLSNPEGSKPSTVRFVCHLDVSANDIDEALRRMRGVFSGGGLKTSA
jgi:threonine aldolase